MIFFYQFLLLFLVILSLPLLLLYLLYSRKLPYLGHYFGRYPGGAANRRSLWFHAVSRGEFETILPLLERLASHFPGDEILVTTTTPELLATIQTRLPAGRVCLFPLDLWFCFHRILKNNPIRAVFLSENDFWPGFFTYLGLRGIPLFFINARVSPGIERIFGLFPSFSERIFSCCTLCFAGTEGDGARLAKLGVERRRILLPGNLKLDRIRNSSPPGDVEPQGLEQGDSRPLFVLGSTHPFEDLPFLEALAGRRELFDDWRIVLAPRKIERAGEIASRARDLGLPLARRSRGESGPLLLLDTLGELSKIYTRANLAFVGGSLAGDVGGHNCFEPLAAGVRTLYGPFHRNYSELTPPFFSDGLLLPVASVTEILQRLEHSSTGPEAERETILARVRKITGENRTACDKIFRILLEWI